MVPLTAGGAGEAGATAEEEADFLAMISGPGTAKDECCRERCA